MVKAVLIDTWWNVNLLLSNTNKTIVSFNRYMVECEFLQFRHIHQCRAGFNRYMVECEFLLLSQYNKQSAVLIDTWWNVNHSPQLLYNGHSLVLIDTWWNVNKSDSYPIEHTE